MDRLTGRVSGLTTHRPPTIFSREKRAMRLVSSPGEDMNNKMAVLAGTMISAVSLALDAFAQTPVPPGCVPQNMAVPPNANTTDKAAPFFIDTTGLDFKTTPPTRDPTSANYPRAAELPDGTLPPPGA